MSSGTTRTSASLIPCRLSQVPTWATFRSWVRPDRISSPITSRPAVQIRSEVIGDRSTGSARRRHGCKFTMSARYIGAMDTHLLDRERGIVGRHGAIKLHGPEGFAGMRAAGRSPPRSSTRSSPMSCPASPPRSSTTSSAEMTLDARRDPGDARLSRLHQELLHLGQPRRLPRHPGRPRAQGRRHRQHRRHPDPRRLARRHQPHVSGRRRRHQGEEARPGHLRMPDARHRAGEARQPARRHRPRHPDPCRGAALFGGPRFLRPRPRPRLPRRAGGGPCRPPGHRPGAPARHVLHDRADDQHRQARRPSCSTTAGPRSPATAASRPSSSTAIGITEDGCEIFTKSPKGLDAPPYA